MKNANSQNFFNFVEGNTKGYTVVSDIDALNLNYEIEMKFDLQNWNEHSFDKYEKY